MLTTIFECAGYEVTTAGSLGEALRLVFDERFDLYILDAQLTDGTGVNLCEKIREIDPHTPIMFYADDAEESQQQQAFCVGATAYVAKPHIDQLVETVDCLLNKPV